MCKSFLVYSLLQGQKPISFAAIVTAYTFNKFHYLHAVDQMLL